MNNPWFRLYSEAVDDEKLRLLAFEDRWHFIAILCCKNTGILDEQNIDLMRRKVAVKLGLDLRELGEVSRRLAEVGLIDNETLQPIKWNDRQYKSDSSKERTKAYRDRQKRHCDVTVTAQETETETETETERAKSNTAVLPFPEPNRKKRPTIAPKDFSVSEEMFDWAVAQGLPEARIRPETEQFLDRNRSKGTTYLDWTAAWRTWIRNAVKFSGAVCR